MLVSGRAGISYLQECDAREVVSTAAAYPTPTHIQAALSGPRVIENKAWEVGRKDGGRDKGEGKGWRRRIRDRVDQNIWNPP